MTAPDLTRPPWIDRRHEQGPRRPMRKVHLDFHNSQHIPQVGAEFDSESFTRRLAGAAVDSVVVFAKDMHGYSYYPTSHGPVHPGLQVPDLLGEQVAACRAAGIAVYAYYCTTWDNYLAERHPEWLCFRRDRSTYLPGFEETPGWTALCLSHPDFIDLMLAQSEEILDRYDVDGIWYDMPLPNADLECFCSRCLDQMRSRGWDPLDVTAQRRHKNELMTRWLEVSRGLAHRLRPGCQVDQNNQTRAGLAGRAALLDNVEIEALPTGGWGYLYFPVMVRLARALGLSSYGMTGRFHRSWADFGGLKHPDQLRTEVAAIAAQTAGVDVGDQLPPGGAPDEGVYEVIGTAYRELARLEPYLDRVAPVTEALLLVSPPLLSDFAHVERPEDEAMQDGVLGLTQLMLETHLQFDVAEVGTVDLDRYRLVVVPDGSPLDASALAQLEHFRAGGGAVLACGASASAAGETGWAGPGLVAAGPSPFVPAFLRLQGDAATWLPAHDYALYEGTDRLVVTSSSGWEVLGRVGEPLFQRSPAHYTSHAQSPFATLTEHAAVVERDGCGLVAFPLGTSYHRHGYWVYREIFQRLLDRVLPERLVTTSAPGSTDVAVTHQAATPTTPERWLVHLVNQTAGRRSPHHLERYEEPVPLTDVRVDLRVPGELLSARAASDGGPLPLVRRGTTTTVVIPSVRIGEIVVLDAGPGQEPSNR